MWIGYVTCFFSSEMMLMEFALWARQLPTSAAQFHRWLALSNMTKPLILISRRCCSRVATKVARGIAGLIRRGRDGGGFRCRRGRALASVRSQCIGTDRGNSHCRGYRQRNCFSVRGETSQHGSVSMPRQYSPPEATGEAARSISEAGERLSAQGSDPWCTKLPCCAAWCRLVAGPTTGIGVLVLDKGVVGWEASSLQRRRRPRHYHSPLFPRGSGSGAADGRSPGLSHRIPARAGESLP